MILKLTVADAPLCLQNHEEIVKIDFILYVICHDVMLTYFTVFSHPPGRTSAQKGSRTVFTGSAILTTVDSAFINI